MSNSKTTSGDLHNFWASPLIAAASIVLLLILMSGIWSPARAAGPALWIAVPQQQPPPPGAKGGLVELRPFQIQSSGTPNQKTIMQAAEPLANSSGLAFQANGALWVCTLNNTVLKFTPGQLSNLISNPAAVPAPKVTITSTSFSFIIGCTMTPFGALWVVDAMGNAVHKISHGQLVSATLAGGNVNLTPAVTITDSTDLASPAFATLDASGNLWVTSEGNNKVVEFAASSLGTTGSPAPKVVISSPSLDGPGQPAFDPSGNLWVTNALNNTVVKFTPAQLSATGSPTAAAVISDNGSSLVTPWGCAFDDLGRLWVFNYGTATSASTTISMFGRGMLAANGASSPTPRITLSGLPPFGAEMAFGPRY